MTKNKARPDPSLLAANSISLPGQLYQSISHMAPAAGVIFCAQFMAIQGGACHPLAWLLATAAALLAAYCLRTLTAKIQHAGGYFTILSTVLGERVGFITSWLYFLYDPLNAAFTLNGFAGIILEPLSKAHFGFTIPWWATLIAGTIVITWLTTKGIKQSVAAMVILGSLEVVILLIMALILIIKAPDGQNLLTFTPTSSPHGWNGVLFAMIFAFLSFVGFESGLPLAEETKDPKHSLTNAIVISTIIVGAFYILLGYASVVGFGGTADPLKFSHEFSQAADPYGGILANRAFGTIGPWLILFAILNSTLACAIAGSNATTRVFYALSRAGIFPRVLCQIHPLSQTPRNAIYLQAFITLGYGLLVGLLFGPINTLGLGGLTTTLALCVIYIMTSIAVFVAYRFKYRYEFHWFKHALIPGISALLLILPIWASLVSNPKPPLSYGPWLVLAWLVLGIGFYFHLKIKRPHTLKELTLELEHEQL